MDDRSIHGAWHSWGLRQSAPRRAWEDTKGVFHNPLFWAVEILGGAVVTAVVINYAPLELTGFLLSLYQALAPASYIIGILFLIFTANLVRAPYRQRNEAWKREAARETSLQVSAGQPYWFRSDETRFIVVPEFHVSNPSDIRMELDISIKMSPRDGPADLVMPAAIKPVAGAVPFVGDSQLSPPLPLEPRH